MDDNLQLDQASQTPVGGGGGATTGTAAVAIPVVLNPDLEAAKVKFDIPQVILDNSAELAQLILVTGSMNDEERQYWFNILPIMSEDQVERLRQILVTEQRKMAELNQTYNEAITAINEKYLLKWQDKQTTEKREKLVQAESQEENLEAKKEEELLSTLQAL
ncbi:hypothetical protein COV81_04615 [Candidatus Peregrinibacteria bacterium CG11_big_fil_rev_8_21_14_0_20_41_10]|nr:MAG: hypothetical protein COV81_04615 [Candidatus Peregrinibacteria bacterium CG11_big_fil_rev_8_21_14_0_20_41_10]PIZ72934.1 MAG: hypothetical protein COY06_06035 [Candidatus Peregrinibacteria bacterium CG_4_10_14_0_2_um_filter_41_8]PJC37717.1 MAG: hypothetical protein CO045_04040 [Candidatus Peregrinibacteria bacterium CG_4_9_14_0_2_um_filter_41_14]